MSGEHVKQDSNRTEGGLRLKGKIPAPIADRPVISVITVVRNAELTIERTIQSVLGQACQNLEYIIIDGGSIDGTLDVVKKYEDRIAYWSSGPDKGIYDAMNKGIAKATGDLVALLNSDDAYEPGALAAVADAYRNCSSTEPCIVYGDYSVLDERAGVKTEFRSDLRFWRGMSICHQAMFVSRGIYRTRTYDTSLRFTADYAFLVDAIQSGIRFVPANAFLVVFGNAGASYTNVWASYREAISVLRRRFGLFSRYLWLFLVIRVLRSLVSSSLKKVLAGVLSPSGQGRIKLFYDRISGRTSRRVSGGGK